MIPGPLLPTIQLEESSSLEAELRERLRLPPPPRRLWVTDLVEPRRAYWKVVHPVPWSPERRRRMQEGRDEHLRLGAELAEARFLEIRVERDGIVGQIDIFEDRPTELKTTGSLPEPSTLRERRPGYLEQLGMYCALADRHDGRLLVLGPSDGDGPPKLQAYACRYPDLGAVWEAVRSEGEHLRSAIEARSPARLPRCPWFGRGCEFQDAGVCDCTGTEPEGFPVRNLAASVELDTEEAARLTERLAIDRPPGGAAPLNFRLRELLFPRRAYFDRRAAATKEEREVEPERPPSEPDTYRRWMGVLERGAAGELTRRMPDSGPVQERITCFRGAPLLLRVSRGWRIPDPADLIREQPQYFLDLVLRCAALGVAEGWLVVVYEHARPPDDGLRILRLRLADPAAAEQELQARARGLEEALGGKSPFSLAPCLGWMVPRCPYRDECGCGASLAAPGRAHL